MELTRVTDFTTNEIEDKLLFDFSSFGLISVKFPLNRLDAT